MPRSVARSSGPRPKSCAAIAGASMRHSGQASGAMDAVRSSPVLPAIAGFTLRRRPRPTILRRSSPTRVTAAMAAAVLAVPVAIRVAASRAALPAARTDPCNTTERARWARFSFGGVDVIEDLGRKHGKEDHGDDRDKQLVA